MMKRIAAALALCATLAAAQPPAAERTVTLQDCILTALRNNLNLAAEVLGPEVAASTAALAGEVFLPKLSFTFGTQTSNQASFSWLDATDQVTTDFADYQGTLEQRLPTGATLSAGLYSYRNETNRSFQTINPRYGSTLNFDFAQPLLRDFGFKMARRQIIIARNNQDISESRLRQALVDTVFDVEEAYWALVYDREYLEVQQESLKLARDLLAKNEKELEAGVIPPIELLSARAEVASREADILQAQAQVKNSQDTLRTLLNLPREKGVPPQVLIPSDRPQIEPFALDLEEAQARALAHRPDLAASQTDIKTKALNLSYARNQTLPNLSLRANYWSPGVSGTQILYQDNDPLTGVIVGTLPGGPSLAFKDAFRFKYENWFVGVTLELPLEAVVTRARVTQARLESEQAALQLRDLEAQALLEVEIALRAVETDYQRIQAYRLARELAEETLAAEVKKLEAGLSTNYTVLQQQRDLALARTNETRARIDYNLSLARLQRAMGTTLEAKDIQLADLPGRSGRP
jgi:outer membrane protein TolC